MVIQVDTREKSKAIKDILAYFDAQQIKYVSSKMYCGDYQLLNNGTLVVDRKQNLLELTQNVCQQHKRFKAEIIRANEAGIRIVFLCEHGKGITCLDDVKNWVNPRLKESPLAMSGERLYLVLNTMRHTYDIDFMFCNKAQTGKRIVEILNDGQLISQ